MVSSDPKRYIVSGFGRVGAAVAARMRVSNLRKPSRFKVMGEVPWSTAVALHRAFSSADRFK